MQQCPSWKGLHLFKKFPAFYGTRKFITAFTWAPPPSVPILNHISPVHTLKSHFLKIHFNIIFPPMPASSEWFFYSVLPTKNPVYTSPCPHTCYMPRPSHSARFDHPNHIWWAVQIIKLLIMQFTPLPCYFVPLRPKYLPQPFESQKSSKV